MQPAIAVRQVLRSVWAYLGPVSAHAFCRFRARSPQAQAMRTALGTLAAQIGPHLRSSLLDVVALGAGDAAHEVRLLESLRAVGPTPLSLALVDLSEPLLARAYPHAAEHLPDVEVWALLADLEDLSMHGDVLFLPGRQRLVLALGGLLGELEDELRFVRHGLARCTEGDLLVLDVPQAIADSAALLWEREGRSAQRLLEEAREWLTAALAPHLPELPLTWSLRLETREVVPGSHAWCAVSRLDLSPRPREIELYRWRRYDPTRLAARLESLGWDLVAACPYGAAAAAGTLHVYRRRAANAVPRRSFPGPGRPNDRAGAGCVCGAPLAPLVHPGSPWLAESALASRGRVAPQLRSIQGKRPAAVARATLDSPSPRCVGPPRRPAEQSVLGRTAVIQPQSARTACFSLSRSLPTQNPEEPLPSSPRHPDP